MSRNFELMNQGVQDSGAIQPPAHGALSSKPKLPNRYTQWMGDVPAEGFAVSLWRIIRGRKWTVAAFTLVVVTIVTVASFLMKPKYEAVGRVVFHRENDIGVLGFKGVDTTLLEDPEDRAAIDTQIGILQTDALAMQVINDLHLDKKPMFAGSVGKSGNEDQLVKRFHNTVTLSKVKGTRLIEIQFRSRDPKLAADVVNDLSKAYVDQFYRSQFQVTTPISEFLADQLKELQAKVEESQQKMVGYQKENGIFGMDDT